MTAERYRGTRHGNRLDLPGEAVDCINFVLAVLRGAGVLPAVQLPFYDERLGSFRARNVMGELFERHFHASLHPSEALPEFGDVIVCRVGRQSNHVGIVLDAGWFWHVPAQGFCSPEAWGAWQHRAERYVRFTATGLRDDPAKLKWREIVTMADRPL